MKILLKLFFLLLSIILVWTPVWALSIISPKEGVEFYAGDQLTIVAKPDPGEEWEKVIFGVYPMSYNAITKEYTYTLTIPRDLSGVIDDMYVIAADKSGNVVKLWRKIIVKIPPDVVLESISIYPEYILLVKLMPDDPQEEKEKYEKRQISVDGRYSDNVERDITGSIRGTLYRSSDENVATVNPEGLVTAQSPGTARIIVQNGKHRTEVTVEVLPVKRWPDGKIRFY